MTKFFLLLTLMCHTACSSPDDVSGSLAIESRLARIENGLTPGFQIQGRDIPAFNIDARMRELNIPGMSVAFVANAEVQISLFSGPDGQH